MKDEHAKPHAEKDAARAEGYAAGIMGNTSFAEDIPETHAAHADAYREAYSRGYEAEAAAFFAGWDGGICAHRIPGLEDVPPNMPPMNTNTAADTNAGTNMMWHGLRGKMRDMMRDADAKGVPPSLARKTYPPNMPPMNTPTAAGMRTDTNRAD